MKYTEFEAKVKGADASLTVEHAGRLLYVRDDLGRVLLHIRKRVSYYVDFGYSDWERASEVLKGKIFYLAYELAATPLEEREEPKKYYYKIPHEDYGTGYMNYDLSDFGVFYSNKNGDKYVQTRFTKAEYAAIAKEKGIPDGYHIPEEVTDDE